MGKRKKTIAGSRSQLVADGGLDPLKQPEQLIDQAVKVIGRSPKHGTAMVG
jgi:hypothetical protein